MTAPFPTLQTTSTGGRVPIHPQPSIFETTIGVIDVASDEPSTLVTHTEIDQILSRPKWSFDEADLRLTNERIAALQKEVDAVVAKKAASKRPVRKTAAKKTTPRKKS